MGGRLTFYNEPHSLDDLPIISIWSTDKTNRSPNLVIFDLEERFLCLRRVVLYLQI
jgi:hypothetical protein